MSKIDKAKVLEMYEAGMGGVTIARELGVHPQTIYYHLKGVKKPNGGRQAKTNKEEVVRLYIEENLSCQQIADKLGLSHSGTVWTRLKNAGIKLRSKSEGMIARGIRKVGPDKDVIPLYNKGLNVAQVARYYNVHDKCIYDILKRHNVKVRSMHGSRNPAWKGGVTKLSKMIRESAKYSEWRDNAMKATDYTCQITGVRGGNLHVHHIVKFSDIVERFIAKHGMDHDDNEQTYRPFESFKPFWPDSNSIVVSDEVHKLIHAGETPPWNGGCSSLDVDHISYQEAKLFLSAYHYTGTAPKGNSHWYGLFAGGSLIGVIGIGRGVNKHLSSGVGGNAMELTRLALVDWAPKNTGSFFLSKAIGQFRCDEPDIEFLVSFADPNVGHNGGVYRAANWRFIEQIKPDYCYVMPDGSREHKSRFRCRDGKTEKQLAESVGAKKVRLEGKLKFVYPIRRRRL